MNSRTLWLAITCFAYLLATGCTGLSERALPFTVVDGNYAFRSQGRYEEPRLVVYAARDEVIPPSSDLEFLSSEARNEIAEIDFTKYVAVLIRHGRSALSAKMKGVTLRGDQVTLLTTADSIVGNYVVVGYTNPYMLIKIEKLGSWGKDMHFVWDAETMPGQTPVTHFVP